MSLLLIGDEGSSPVSHQLFAFTQLQCHARPCTSFLQLSFNHFRPRMEKLRDPTSFRSTGTNWNSTDTETEIERLDGVEIELTS